LDRLEGIIAPFDFRIFHQKELERERETFIFRSKNCL